MLTKPYFLHALSPLHAGTGQSVEAIDLPIARMRSMGIPFVPGSSIKGVLRDERRNLPSPEEWIAIFGPEKEGDEHAGAIVVGDARLLLLPVRSFKGVFAWVTSPLWLTLAKRDLDGAPGVPSEVPSVNGAGAKAASTTESALVHQGKVYLEDLDLAVTDAPVLAEWGDFFAKSIAPAGHSEVFTKRFVLVDDETMSFLAETATQVDTRIRLDADTRVVVEGALWTEESLPPESVLIGVLGADRSRRRSTELNPEEVMKKALPDNETTFQFGGKATIGHGRCRFVLLR